MKYKVVNPQGCNIFSALNVGEEPPRQMWRRAPARRLAFGDVFEADVYADAGGSLVLRLADYKGQPQLVAAVKNGVVFAEPFVVAVVPPSAISSPTSSALEERLAAIEARLVKLEG